MASHGGPGRTRRGVLFAGMLVVALCASSFGTASASAADDPGAVPDRPWRIPTIAPGSPCPVTKRASQPSRDLGVMVGSGPARPVGIGPNGVLEYARAHRPGTVFVDSEWGGQKVLWAVAPKVKTAVRVRGRQLDGAGTVRFGMDVEPATDLLLTAPEPGVQRMDGGWRDFPSVTRVQQPGCYAYQVDTPSKSTVIVFEARDEL